MNKLKTLVLFALLAFSLPAGAQKIAHINFDSLVSVMPETKTATEVAQSYLKGLQDEIIAMQNELETKYKKYMEDEPNLSELVKKSQMESLQQLQARIQDFQQQAAEDYKRKQEELTRPIFEKAKKAVDAVAKEMGYKYVLDTSPSNNTVLYFDGSDDIFIAVKKKLESMPAAVIPGAQSTQPKPGAPAPKPAAPAQTPPKKTN
jgi:outer membrane protein